MSSKQNSLPLEDLSLPEIDPEEFKKNAPKLSNEKLCEVIMTFRYLGIMQNEAIIAMEQLASRRGTGDIFDYETRITELMADLPKITLDLNKILKSYRI